MVKTSQFSSEIPNIGFLRLPQIIALIPIGRSTWWKWVAVGKAPKPLKLGPRTTVWKAEDIARLIAELDARGGKL